jgi:hypothetical protein
MQHMESNHDAEQPLLPPELQKLEAQFGALQPREDRIEREQLMFLAGQASVAPITIRARRSMVGWRLPASVGAVAGAAAALLMVALVTSSMTNQSTTTTGRPNVVVTDPVGIVPGDERFGLLSSSRIRALAPDEAVPTDTSRMAEPLIASPQDDGPALTSRSIGDVLL